jgi:hypothetical protein
LAGIASIPTSFVKGVLAPLLADRVRQLNEAQSTQISMLHLIGIPVLSSQRLVAVEAKNGFAGASLPIHAQE